MTKTIITPVEESTEYENFLDIAAIQDDDYTNSLEKFTGYIDTASKDIVTEVRKESTESVLRVQIDNLDDLKLFCEKVKQIIPPDKNEIYYPKEDTSRALFVDDEEDFVITDTSLIEVKKKKFTISKEKTSWIKHWKNMPDYDSMPIEPYKKVAVKFRNDEDRQKFIDNVCPYVNLKTKSTWFPFKENRNLLKTRWIEDNPKTNPKYPLYIVSKGRHESMLTSRALVRMQVPHYIVIEPQDKERYEEAVKKFNLSEYVTLLVAPFSNHGDGPGRARNWAWDHSISIGATHHWVLDDNIHDFYRFHKQIRIRVATGAFFRAMEDFSDRYENVYISGPQYYFFAVPGKYLPAYITNTRIYSVLLIRNSCKHRWRGRYNEDTDLCLRVLKDGNCTIEYYFFLQDKAPTQTVKGGNTEEFYHKEGNGWTRGGKYNTHGTVNKSKMLVDMHPDVARMVWKYDRWHHHVDYSVFRKNKLKLKKGLIIPDTPMEFNNLRLVNDYEEGKY